MTERCPLVDFESTSQIPTVCGRQCYELWEKASAGQAAEHDEFVRHDDEGDTCSHPFSETGTESLRVWKGSERLYSVNEDCMSCGAELGSDTYRFTCPYNT